jgi:hypothetical protein
LHAFIGFKNEVARPTRFDRVTFALGAGLTSRLNKLEAQNFLARLPEPNDRRTLRVQLTAVGEVIINEAIPRVFEAQRGRLLQLGPDGQKRLVEELTRFAELSTIWNPPQQRSHKNNDASVRLA